MYLSTALEGILKIQRRLCRAQLYLIVSIVTEDAKKVQFMLLAADTMQARLVNPLDQDQDQNKKSSFEIKPMSWNEKGHKGKTMGNKKGYEIYIGSQNQVLFLTPLFGVFYEKKRGN